MSYELTGVVKVVQEEQTFGSGFTKQELVVTVSEGKYPQDINIEFVQDKTSLLSDVRAGDEVTVTFDIRGREYNGRYFNNLNGWKLSVAGGRHGAPPVEGAEPSGSAPVSSDPEYEDDIPF